MENKRARESPSDLKSRDRAGRSLYCARKDPDGLIDARLRLCQGEQNPKVTRATPDADSNLYFHERSWLADESVILFTSKRTNGGLMGYITATGELIRFNSPQGPLGAGHDASAEQHVAHLVVVLAEGGAAPAAGAGVDRLARAL